MAKKENESVIAKQFSIGERDATLSRHNRSPLYHQLYLILRSKILDGEYAPQDYLPGERELEALFGVSRITAVRALNELAADGLVVRERGRGTRVQFVGRGIITRGPASLRTASENSASEKDGELFQTLMNSGKANATLYDFDYVIPPPEVADALGLPEDAVVQYAVRVWRFEKKPINHVITYVPEDIGRLWKKKDLEKRPLYSLLEKKGHKIASVHEKVTATLADVVISMRLEIATGSPVLKIKRTAYDAKGRAVEYLIGSYPPERYQYEVSLPQQGGAIRKRH